MAKTTKSIRIEDSLMAILESEATKQRRSFNNLVEIILEDYVKNLPKPDDQQKP